MERSTLNIRNIDFIELSRMMPYTVTQEKIEEKGLEDFVAVRKTNMGRKPKVTGQELVKRFSTMNPEESIWNYPREEPDGEEVKRMLATAIAEEVRFLLKRHTFRYGDRIILQDEGGAIGSELTQVVSKSRVIVFTWKLKELLLIVEKRWFKYETYFRRYVTGTKEYTGWRKTGSKDIKLILSRWYVDDNTVVSSRIEPGWRFNKEMQRMEWKIEWEREDAETQPDQVTAKAMVSIMNSIDPDIQLTWDTPSNNQERRMPVLDLKLWMEQNHEGVNRIRFSYYEKPMASKYVIMAGSGLSWQVKRSSLAGEVARRRLNMDDEAWQQEGIEVLERFNCKMMRSGYTEYQRSVIVKEGLARVDNIKNKVELGIRPLYRMATWHKKDRALEKKAKAKKWAGNVESVLFVQATPGEILKKRIQEVANSSGFQLRIVEKGGRTLKSMLMKSDVKPNKRCWDQECPICMTGEQGKCNKENAGYTIQCKTCWESEERKDAPIKQKRYIMHGETSRSARVRCKEHKNALERKEKSNLWEHCVLEHDGNQAEFSYKVERCFHRDSMLRQIDEARRLEEEQGTILNDKLEFVRPFGVQLKATRMGN